MERAGPHVDGKNVDGSYSALIVTEIGEQVAGGFYMLPQVKHVGHRALIPPLPARAPHPLSPWGSYIRQGVKRLPFERTRSTCMAARRVGRMLAPPAGQSFVDEGDRC